MSTNYGANVIVGIALKDVYASEVNDAVDKVKKALAKFGYTGEIKVFCQLNWG
jgi:hypothetical protein